jgi:hypothetical protein
VRKLEQQQLKQQHELGARHVRVRVHVDEQQPAV